MITVSLTDTDFYVMDMGPAYLEMQIKIGSSTTSVKVRFEASDVQAIYGAIHQHNAKHSSNPDHFYFGQKREGG